MQALMYDEGRGAHPRTERRPFAHAHTSAGVNMEALALGRLSFRDCGRPK